MYHFFLDCTLWHKVRDCDMATFFSMRTNPFFHEEDSNPSDIYDVNVLDGAAVVHFLSTVDIATFDEYADCVFLLHITKLLNNASRMSSYKIEEGKGCMTESCG